MPRRFSRASRSIPDSRGRKATKVGIYTIKYRNFHIEYQWQQIAEEILITISTIPKTPLPLLEFSIKLEDLGDWGVEKYIKTLIIELETLRKEVKDKVMNYFLIGENSLTDEQIAAFSELLRRKII